MRGRVAINMIKDTASKKDHLDKGLSKSKIGKNRPNSLEIL